MSKQQSIPDSDLSIQAYHQRSKHSLDAYARGPETLDWDSQPDPFRHYAGCETLPLQLNAAEDKTPFRLLSEAPHAIAPRPLERDFLGRLLELSMGLSAWKSFGPDRWSLRVNPSSGNLHPTEAYLILADGEGFDAGVYHYNSYHHHLERRCPLTSPPLAPGQFLIGLSSIHRRESWKYGERAYRYCQHDVGHALAALRYACAVLGWHLSLLDECSDQQIATLLGIDRADDYGRSERESPDLLLQIDTLAESSARCDIHALLETIDHSLWQGEANRLTDDNFYKWPVIHQAEQAASKPPTPVAKALTRLETPLPASGCPLSASELLRRRRSAQAFEGGAPAMKQATLARLLEALIPRQAIAPLDCLPWAPRLHLLLFVHRVEGLEPGLYALPRSAHGKALLQEHLSEGYDWLSIEGLPLYQLKQGTASNSARTLACHQPIASDSAFSLAMLAEFETSLEARPWVYRQLHWEAGAIGQALYIEAEAAGHQGTGIGCFFDDALHEMVGIKTSALQDLYHFTVGIARIDSRLQSEPPYAHLPAAQQRETQ